MKAELPVPQYNPPTHRLTTYAASVRPSRAGSAIAVAEAKQPKPLTPPVQQTQTPVLVEEAGDFTVILTAQALYNYTYTPCGDPSVDGLEYLSFVVGDTIHIVSAEDSEWWIGENLRTHNNGFFPANLVVVVSSGAR